MNINHIMLDLDQTLICATSQEKAKRLIDLFKNSSNMVEYFSNLDYVIFMRPTLLKFMKYLCDNYKVSVFTAAESTYAKNILKHILPSDAHLELFLTRSHFAKCQRDMSSGCGKIISWVKSQWPKYKNDTFIIIDDLPEVYSNQPNNAIHIAPWNFRDKIDLEDRELENILQWLKYNTIPLKRPRQSTLAP